MIYLGMVILTLTTFWSVRRGLRHFAEQACASAAAPPPGGARAAALAAWAAAEAVGGGAETLAVILRDELHDAVGADRHFREYLRITPTGSHAEEAKGSLLKPVPDASRRT